MQARLKSCSSESSMSANPYSGWRYNIEAEAAPLPSNDKALQGSVSAMDMSETAALCDIIEFGSITYIKSSKVWIVWLAKPFSRIGLEDQDANSHHIKQISDVEDLQILASKSRLPALQGLNQAEMSLLCKWVVASVERCARPCPEGIAIIPCISAIPEVSCFVLRKSVICMSMPCIQHTFLQDQVIRVASLTLSPCRGGESISQIREGVSLSLP